MPSALSTSNVVDHMAFSAAQPAQRPPVQVPVIWNIRRFIRLLAIMASSTDRMTDR